MKWLDWITHIVKEDSRYTIKHRGRGRYSLVRQLEDEYTLSVNPWKGKRQVVLSKSSESSSMCLVEQDRVLAVIDDFVTLANMNYEGTFYRGEWTKYTPDAWYAK